VSYDSMFQKAIELQNAGAINQAEEIYLQILQVMPENSDVWNLLGLIAQSKGNLTHAVDCFLTAIKYAPTPFFAHYFNLGLVYKSLNKPKESLDAFTRSVQLKKDFKEGWNALGVIQAENNLSKDAVKSFCRALELDNNYEEARVNLCYYTNDLNSIINLANEEKDNFFAQIKAAEVASQPDEKEIYLQRAVDLQPERTDALVMMADLYHQQGNFNKALTFYHKVLNLDEYNVHALLGAADIYLAQGVLDKAEKYYLKSFDVTRDIVGAHINYGSLLYQQKRFSEALEEYRKAVAINPENPAISYNLALILKETGDIEEALGLMFHAHLKEPDNDMFAINIAETLAGLFETQPEAALKIAENWQKQEPDNVFSKHVLASLSGTSESAENELYAEKLFNHFATTYEQTLDKLNPRIIAQFQNKYGKIKGNVLDLGCGTGLAAQTLKNDENVFDGVDISEEMLKIAESKKLYRQLFHQDIKDFLKKHSAHSYDWVLAFDVFCYLGDLAAVLTLLKGCCCCFSIEIADEDRHQNYYLNANGRYKHKKSYVSELLKKLKFKQIEATEMVLRQENGSDVNGVLFMVK